MRRFGTILTLFASVVLCYDHEGLPVWEYGPPPEPPITCNTDMCSSLKSCYQCTFPDDCKYGEMVDVICVTGYNCTKKIRKKETFTSKFQCRYCYQTDPSEQICQERRNCSVTAAPPRNMVHTVCTVRQDIVCMGSRTFYKYVRCDWTSGYKWSTAFILSVTLGGFGADRFYLGLWKSGVGKLFSFGGLGVWTLIDVILIGTGYIGPADGSLYMY